MLLGLDILGKLDSALSASKRYDGLPWPMLLEELATALSTLVGDLWDTLLRRTFPRARP